MAAPRKGPVTTRGAVNRDRRGVYNWKGESFPSVTTVQRQQAKPALIYWSAKMVAEHVGGLCELVEAERMTTTQLLTVLKDTDKLKGVPWSKRDDKADIGTTVHAVADLINSGGVVDPGAFSLDVAPYIRAYIDWFGRWTPDIEALEATVYNRRHNYAGTFDAIATFPSMGGRKLLVDFKSSSATYPEHAVQMAAYRHAEFIGLPSGEEHPMPQVDGGALLLLGPDTYTFYEWSCGSREFEVFLALRHLHDWSKSEPAPTELK